MIEYFKARSSVKVAPRADWLLAGLILVPTLIMLGKLLPTPIAGGLADFFSVDHVPAHARHVVASIFFVPVGALVVVAFRRMLGLKVLGFFRPILLAVAFASLGVPLGLACLIGFLTLMAAVRPMLQDAPYNTRIPIQLSLVAAVLVMLLAAAEWWQLAWLEQAAYFPVIALCLTCESFAKVLERDGLAEAAWQTMTTVMAAIVITALAGVPGFMRFMLRTPEILFLEAGAILLLARHLSFRLFEGWNPLSPRTVGAAVGENDEAADRRHVDD